MRNVEDADKVDVQYKADNPNPHVTAGIMPFTLNDVVSNLTDAQPTSILVPDTAPQLIVGPRAHRGGLGDR